MRFKFDKKAIRIAGRRSGKSISKLQMILYEIAMKIDGNEHFFETEEEQDSLLEEYENEASIS